MKIRHKLVIILAALLVTLNGVIAVLIYKRTRLELIKEVREKAKLIAVEFEIMRNHLATILKESHLETSEQTKQFIPAVYGHNIGLKFTKTTGYVIKQTSLKYRNIANKPDAFEEKILKRMESEPNLQEYWGNDFIDGERVERYLYALQVKEECLPCHSAKEKAPAFIQANYDTGYDYKAGEVRGAISVVIPREISERQFITQIVFFIIIGATSVLFIVAIVFVTTKKFMLPIERLTGAVTTIANTGNLTTKINVSSTDEVGVLGKAFNNMATTLQTTYNTLEQRIADKTSHLQHAILALERASKMKSEFLANMSHELRTPLNAIIGFAEVIRDKIAGEINDEQLDYIKDIHSSGIHLLQMINDILDLSKIEAGKMELQYETFVLQDAINDVYTILKGLASKKRLELSTSILTDIASIEADRVKFKQILYNLLSNAIKFTPENGKIVLEATIIDDMLQISVSDTGIGMKPEDQKRVFSEFWQADSSFARKYEGTGLGLALTKRIVEMHKGKIWFESEYGKGSVFYFAMPLRPQTQPEKLKNVEAKPYQPTLSAEKAAKTVIIGEDDHMASDILSLYLTNAGYNVIVATDGEDVIRKAKQAKPLLITLDVMLPKKDGWDVLSELKNSPDTADIPVIIISVIDNKDLGFSLGATEYLIKPIDRVKLISTVNACIQAEKTASKPVKILVIDDDENAVKLASTTLENAGFETMKAYGGKAGIDMAINGTPALIILDLMMPEVSGFDVVETLRKHPSTKEIPIIICTSKDITAEEKQTLSGNILAIVQKGSYTKEDLLATIKRVEKVRVKVKDVM